MPVSLQIHFESFPFDNETSGVSLYISIYLIFTAAQLQWLLSSPYSPPNLSPIMSIPFAATSKRNAAKANQSTSRSAHYLK
jgi:hypothetical protein